MPEQKPTISTDALYDLTTEPGVYIAIFSDGEERPDDAAVVLGRNASVRVVLYAHNGEILEGLERDSWRGTQWLLSTDLEIRY